MVYGVLANFVIQMNRGRVVVIGAGPAGLTAAYELSKAGYAVDVFEAGPQVGGLSKSIELWGQTVDLGPHRFFSTDSRVNKLWLEVAQGRYRMVDRLTRIYYNNKFFYYPLKPFDALRKLGVVETIKCIGSYSFQQLKPLPENGTFENWVINRFGRRLFEIFFKTYSEKLWGISCADLDSDFAAQRIKKLSLFEAIKNAFIATKQTKHKTLVDQFAYPLQGSGMIYNSMQEYIDKNGGKVYLNSPIRRVLTTGNKVDGIELESGEVREYEHVISTMPITLLVSKIKNVPEEVLNKVSGLRFRNTILVYLKVDAEDLFPDNWLYIHSKDLQVGRITNFRNWVPELNRDQKSSILALEFWCNDDDPLWKEKDEVLIDMAKKELEATGLNKSAAISDGYVYRILRCYPVYEKGYKEKLVPVQEFLSGFSNLSVIGRYGAFKYNNQDHSILMGILAAENISKGAAHNLWEINTDYEDYQEATVISKSGLVPASS